MKKFFKENWFWLIVASVTIALYLAYALMPDGSTIRKILISPFYLIGAAIILVGIGKILEYFEKEDIFTQTWHVALTFIILVLSITVLAL